MKIGILTLPLKTNYGGILQAYALQYVLRRMGNDVSTFNIQQREVPFYIKFLSLTKRLFLKFILKKKNVILRGWISKRDLDIISKNLDEFIEKNINLTDKIKITRGSKQNINNYFDVYIVGSDQVWRPKMVINLEFYYLNFIYELKKVKRVAYAVSFGVDNKEYSKKKINKCFPLIQKFNSISVRENSGINLCQEYFSKTPIQVLDPTMLLKKEDYLNLIPNKKNTKERNNEIFAYILDDSEFTNNVVKIIANNLKKKVVNILPNEIKLRNNTTNNFDLRLPSIESWIEYFNMSDFIITDSFHGTVFSILFNKPFVTISNYNRGKSRLSSLLKIFKLENRLINSISDLNTIADYKSIDFENVNRIMEIERNKSISFLKNSLIL